ncbi:MULTISPECIES: YtxH domain-containing protein [Helicobacter]|uniref:YtxH domain-containing protein n=1 Tax=Helicobacter ibis TaxID=2962633 RepID=A0ABT4VED4_9HELI|nr:MULTISPECIES: YtxH domain-containing protein [Helicobacter]MDA3967492.1 YtxH domain-containing protein [Helicobacter sp. WB40]MDA3969068.1 YtxH domain-containing protein [Helicobacter ibis]
MALPNKNNPYINKNNQNSNTTNDIGGIFGNQDSQRDFIKGALIGAVATFLLTNENAQRTLFKGFAKVSELFEAGIEELKERYEDAKAEVKQD